MKRSKTIAAMLALPLLGVGLAVPTAAAAADQELIVNGTFESGVGHAPWWNTGNVDFDTASGAYCVDVPAGLEQWEVIVGQHDLMVEDGAPYTLSFDASSDVPTTIRAQVQPTTNPDGVRYLEPTMALDAQSQAFSYTFTPDLAESLVPSSIQFRLGDNPASEICLDNISLTTPEVVAEPVGPDELLSNTTFDETHKPWWTSGEMPMSISSGELCVDASASTNLWDLLIGQNSLYLPGDTRFRLSFDVRASDAVQNAVQIGPFYNPDNTAFLSHQFAVGTAMTHVSYDFETTYDEEYVLSQLQFRVGGSASPYTVCYDNVTLEGTAYDYVADTGPAVKVNQVGYLPHGPKNATVVSDSEAALGWTLLRGGAQIATGSTVPAGFDATAGVSVHTIDFSDVAATGEDFTLQVGAETSHPFRIAADVYQELRTDSMRFFYTNRSGIAIDGAIAGEEYARDAGHIGVAPNQGDIEVGCQSPKAYMDNWTCDYTLDVTGGWYDAGDHGKYVVNGGIATAQLLSTWERALAQGTEAALGDSTLAIPERGNGIPDILDEAKWSLDFLLKMQVPEGKPLAGMAHHKVHDETWTGLPLLPSADPKLRELHRPSTAATLNLAAVAAQGSRLFATFDADYAAQLLAAAERAYDAAEQHPTLFAPEADGDDGGGAYADDDVTDEFYWAAAELYLTTHDSRYRDDFDANALHDSDTIFTPGGFYWGEVAPLARMQLARFGDELSDIVRIRQSVVDAADMLADLQDAEPFGQPYSPDSGRYVWGSNSSILNNQVVLATAFDLTGTPRYARAALEGYDYLMGRNVLGQSYITGWGENDAHNQHSRWYANALDPALPNPPVGSISGGPNSDIQDPISQVWLEGCVPQACYVDNIEAWAVNEITVNWNSALVWVSSFIADLGDGAVSEDRAVATPARGDLSHNNGWDTGLQDGDYDITMNLWWGENATTFRLYENGTLIETEPLVYAGSTPQSAVIPITGRSNGTYVYTGELVNSKGTMATSTTTVQVTDAAPGVPTISHDNWDQDGTYTVSADLWWGTNATSYRIFENGVVVSEDSIAAHTPGWQRAQFEVSGKAPGTYTYVVEFINAAGTASSTSAVVTVRD